MRFERSKDWQLIKDVVSHPKIYPRVSDDYSPAPDKWEPIRDELVWYVTCHDRKRLLGLWAFFPENRICYDVHTCLLPEAYGDNAKRAVKELVPWVWENTPFLRVITKVPKYNRLALRFALLAGMKEFGVNPLSYMKNDQLHDVILLGISRPGAY